MNGVLQLSAHCARTLRSHTTVYDTSDIEYTWSPLCPAFLSEYLLHRLKQCFKSGVTNWVGDEGFDGVQENPILKCLKDNISVINTDFRKPFALLNFVLTHLYQCILF